MRNWYRGLLEASNMQATCNTNADGANSQSVRNLRWPERDCDGVTDDGLGWFDPEIATTGPLGAACNGIGQCGAGVVECTTSGTNIPTCSTNPNGSAYVFAIETCNNLDDDCDGLTDNTDGALTPGVQCTLTGVCNAANVIATCTAGQWDCDYSDVAGYEVTELTCDGLDNDCDGLTDEPGLSFPGQCVQPGVCATVPCNGAAGWTCEYDQSPIMYSKKVAMRTAMALITTGMA